MISVLAYRLKVLHRRAITGSYPEESSRCFRAIDINLKDKGNTKNLGIFNLKKLSVVEHS